MTKKLPLFYYPPAICWIDDDQLFLNAAQNLFERSYKCITFVDAKKAIDYLTAYELPHIKNNFTREFIESDIYDTHNHLPIDINISEITDLVNKKTIHNDIAILIIDNHMPYKNGIQICYEFKGASYKKILLTGQAHPAEVIDAFNNGIIDKFIEKDTCAVERLQKNIYELSLQYFYEKTKFLISHIETSRPSPLTDEIFINFFYEWCELMSFVNFILLISTAVFWLKIKKID